MSVCPVLFLKKSSLKPTHTRTLAHLRRMSLRDKVIFITGASRGIGKAIALRYFSDLAVTNNAAVRETVLEL